jgi:hypothetical protein
MVSDKLRDMIRKKFKTDTNFANYIGMPRYNLTRKLLGKRIFTFEDIVKIASALDISFNEIGEYFCIDTERLKNVADGLLKVVNA